MKTHWRKVALIDEGWKLEADDPTFRASADADCHDEIDGRRPLASVWRWSTTDRKPLTPEDVTRLEPTP